MFIKILYEFYSVLTCLFVTKSVAEQFRKDLLNIAMTTLSSKILSQDKVHFANLAVDAVLRLKVIPLILCRNVKVIVPINLKLTMLIITGKW